MTKEEIKTMSNDTLVAKVCERYCVWLNNNNELSEDRKFNTYYELKEELLKRLSKGEQ